MIDQVDIMQTPLRTTTAVLDDFVELNAQEDAPKREGYIICTVDVDRPLFLLAGQQISQLEPVVTSLRQSPYGHVPSSEEYSGPAMSCHHRCAPAEPSLRDLGFCAAGKTLVVSSPSSPTSAPSVPTTSLSVTTASLSVATTSFSVATTSSPSPPPPPRSCPIFAFRLGVCAPVSTACLCLAARLRFLGLRVSVPGDVARLLTFCGRPVPSGLTCS
ncbi:unnamed protein product [Spirodela intermedia]|uniref:Uncharacterized protein n=1 Tax=Spirodela intermedia TaxID=51605 RepID=A0A7I8IES3_SPIIN|nr:unnamed protein product [Spirodela intermedia]CAA6656121.1 unnamed protein product [Spirodela intermedia]